jgi:hypothetical protein
MLRNERNSPTLRSLSDDDQWNALADIWSEIKMLTGALLHTGKLLETQLRVLQRFLASAPKFATLTTNEILHAFYLNDAGEYGDIIRHYNQELNAEFVGSVLSAYVRKRVKLYGDHRAAISQALNPETFVAPVYGPEDWKRFIQQDYGWYRNGDAAVNILNTTPKYLFLRRCGLIQFTSRKKFWTLYRQALGQRENRAIQQAIRERSRLAKDNAVDMYTAIRETGVTTRQEHQNTLWLMRRQVYLKFFELIHACAINDIFSEIQYKPFYE